MAKTSSTLFTRDTMQFLMELRFNNNRAWFDANKARYEDHVKKPMLDFITAVGPALRKVNRDFVADPRPSGGSMFRIYRDTRFSKDKTPYKTHVAASFHHKAGKDVHAPGFYFHLEPDRCFAGAGIWHPEPEALKLIRDYVVAQPRAWAAAKKDCPPLGGESLTRVPKDYPKDHPLAQDLRRKDFILSVELREKDVLGPRFVEVFAKACAEVNPMVRTLCKALRV